MKLLRLVPLIALFAFASALPVAAADLCLAVINYQAAGSEEKILQAIPQLDVEKLGRSDKVKSRVKELDGGDVLFFIRVPAAPGRLVTRLGVQRADLEYSVKDGAITARVEIAIGTKLPSGQVGLLANGGSAKAEGARAVLLDRTARESQNTLRTHGNSRVVRSRSLRLLVAQIVR